ncbi:uncharacterized protein LOC132257593 isoform X2 [Phlebotomus argentipes]|uniref:uncharacterized protein LOC132257593 isoform X2 n=1 Tax=Phlebotomus argentipes TaxID=94469 RepID=UPI0028936669|nr:uncharacterized protein LOC132257593 isoform X2 [Phlebotomus argentipes]
MEDSGIDSGEKNEKIVLGGVRESEESSSNEDEIEVIFRGVPSASKTTYVPPTSSCRMMQRKLELKVERAKRTYQKLLKTDDSPQTKSSNIIPINRLQIPGHVEDQPLVEYKSDHSDDELSPSFFPNSRTALKKHDFDTFSIQELPVSNSEDEDSQTLELVPPTSEDHFLTKLTNLFCCGN